MAAIFNNTGENQVIEHQTIPTSAEVWAVIHARHRDTLKVFSSYSYPDGNPNGDPNQARMFTAYGFERSDCPLLAVRTTWDIERDENGDAKPGRKNEKHEYWLCAPVESDD